jgi:type VI secretion system protein VasD
VLHLTADNEQDLLVQVGATWRILQADLAPEQNPWTRAEITVQASSDALVPAAYPSSASYPPIPLRADASSMPRGDMETPRSLGSYDAPLADGTPVTDAVDPEQIATPIGLKIVALKDDSVLLNADYAALDKDLKHALGTTYLSHDDYVLRPGQFKFVEASAVPAHTHYIAVIAAFHDLDHAQWKKVFRIEPTGRRYALLLTVDGKDVALQDENTP